VCLVCWVCLGFCDVLGVFGVLGLFGVGGAPFRSTVSASSMHKLGSERGAVLQALSKAHSNNAAMGLFMFILKLSY